MRRNRRTNRGENGEDLGELLQGRGVGHLSRRFKKRDGESLPHPHNGAGKRAVRNARSGKETRDARDKAPGAAFEFPTRITN